MRLPIGVLLCSYGRPQSLPRVLEAPRAQRDQPDGIRVVVRPGDTPVMR